MMPQQTDGLICKCHLSALMVAFLLLTQTHGGRPQLIGQPQPIVARFGADITLPCHVEHSPDASDVMLEWSRPDLDPRFVHVRRSGQDRLVDQNPSYEGRTSVSVDGLKHGDVSLKLSTVKVSDEGTYKCFIPALESVTDVQLGVVSDAVVQITRVGSVALQCESVGWYPEPEVLWLDGEGNLLSAGPTETVRGPDDLYTVSSRVIVEKRHSNSFTCRVQQKDTNQSRETHIELTEDFLKDSYSSAASTAVGLVVGMLLILGVAFVGWKWRQHTIKSKKHQVDEETLSGGENKHSETNSLLHKEKDGEQLSAETETRKNQEELKGENTSECLGQGTGLSCKSKEETQHQMTEAETYNTLNQPLIGKTKSVGDKTPGPGTAGTETPQEKSEPDTKTLLNQENKQSGEAATEDKTSVEDKTTGPGPAGTETPREKSDSNVDQKNDAGTNGSETAATGQKDEDGQQLQAKAEEKDKNDTDPINNDQKIGFMDSKPAGQASTQPDTLSVGKPNTDKEENTRETQSTNDKPADQAKVNDGQQQSAPSAGEGTEDGVKSKETSSPTPTQEQVQNSDSGEGGENEEPSKDGPTGQIPKDDSDETNKDKITLPTDISMNNEPAGQDPTETETQNNQLQAGGDRNLKKSPSQGDREKD